MIGPDFLFIERQTKEVWRGMITIRYVVMSLFDPCYVSVTPEDDRAIVEKLRAAGLPIIRRAKVGSSQYAEWLRRWHPEGNIFPHIQWGGHVESVPGGDGGRGYADWKLHALTLW
jgi:hypothetical protein